MEVILISFIFTAHRLCCPLDVGDVRNGSRKTNCSVEKSSLLLQSRFSISWPQTFGHPVTIKYIRPENVFFLDETDNNTQEKDNGNRGGQRKLVPKGEIPKEIVGVRDSHFTITPITDAIGKLRFVMVVFAANEVSPEWSLGIYISAEWDSEDELNLGPGKRHPGLTLVSDGKDIPVLFAANTKASMTSGILKDALKN